MRRSASIWFSVVTPRRTCGQPTAREIRHHLAGGQRIRSAVVGARYFEPSSWLTVLNSPPVV
jgi:hypothetical protein